MQAKLHNLVSQLKTTGSLTDKKPDRKITVLADEKLEARRKK